VFWDLRGFTSFVDRTQPDEVARVLRGYHRLVGEAVRAYGGTLERFTGDGTMVFFSDTAPLRNSAHRAVRMALSLRAGFVDLDKEWRARGEAARREVAGGHPGAELSETAMQGEPATAVARAVEDVVDDE
jgi:adenylate cyclase